MKHNLPYDVDFASLIVKGYKPIEFPSLYGLFPEDYDELPEGMKEQYKYDPITRTYNAADETIFSKRREHGAYYYDPTHPLYMEHCLGGSDPVAGEIVMKEYDFGEGQKSGHFQSRNELFWNKVGKPLPFPHKSNDKLFARGHAAESYISRMLPFEYREEMERLGVAFKGECHFVPDDRMYAHSDPKYKGITYNPDGRFVDNELEMLCEFKRIDTNSPYNRLIKNGFVPVDHECQTRKGMAVLNLPAALYCAWFPASDTFFIKLIIRDFELEKMILEADREFLEAIAKEEEPDPALISDSETLARYYVRKNGPLYEEKSKCRPVQLPASMMDDIEELSALNAEIDAAAANLDAKKKMRLNLLTEKFFPVMSPYTFGTMEIEDPDEEGVPKEQYVISLQNSPQYGRLDIDIDKLRAALGDEAEDYITKTETTVTDKTGKVVKQTSVETVNKTLFRKKHPELAHAFDVDMNTEKEAQDYKNYMNVCSVVRKDIPEGIIKQRRKEKEAEEQDA